MTEKDPHEDYIKARLAEDERELEIDRLQEKITRLNAVREAAHDAGETERFETLTHDLRQLRLQLFALKGRAG